MGWSRSLARSFACALCAQCSAAGGAWTRAPPAGGRRRSRVSSADSALRSLGPHCPLLGAAEAAPRWDVPRHLPAPPAPSSGGGFCSIIGAPSPSRGSGSLFVPLLKGSSPGLCHGIHSQGPLALSSLPQPQTWKEASVPSRGKFISGVGAGHSSFHSLLAGVGVGVTRAPKENASIRRLWGPALSLTHVCLSSALRCVWDLSAWLARSLRPRESPEHRRLVPSAPGHAAAATAELLAAVAPPVRRPEMPLPL